MRVAVGALVLLLAAGAGFYYWTVRSDRDSARTVAIVNEDEGSPGSPVKIGDQVVDLLKQESKFDWEVVAPDVADNSKYLAAVKIPTDFSDAVSSLGTPTPRQAVLTVSYNGSGSVRDKRQVDSLITAVSDQTGAAGVRDYLLTISQARQKLQQTQTIANLLSSGVAAADEQAQTMLSGADQILPYLETARAGANQLVDVAGQVSGAVNGADGSVTELADRLSALGVTIGDLNRGNERARTGLDQAANLLEASGLPTGDVVRDLRQTRSDLELASNQLNSVTGLVGSDVGPDTELGEVLRSGFGQLQSVSAQLSDAGALLQEGIGPIADQAPELLGGSKDQILGAITQLKNVSKSLADQLNTGVSTIPAGNPQQASAVLSAPISVVDQNRPAGFELFTARNLAILFGITTALLAAALVWSTRRPKASAVDVNVRS
ncbi:YhgE/Pip domain-containing protein [Antrihabitans sp. YC2-6]|uniref:YhgE/Pip domain-containing protein n=1 Tax=Antrihabitans sp. YC2-6 TaxID=2799498 RepID=UPI0018F6C299|nr:hypothetical protein [Antrihabitans sp. YC2-6]MBJ8346040.1 hypothetical protein [Antrihabitans sp. YC2-6]